MSNWWKMAAKPLQTKNPWERHIVSLPSLYHLGTMDPTRKVRNSHEGHAISVSQHPNAWRQIAQLGGLPQWKFTNPKSRFIDFHRAKRDKKLMQSIVQWGMSQGLVEMKPVWRVYSTDEEGEERYMTFIDFHKAIEEAGYVDESQYRQVQQDIASGQELEHDPEFEFQTVKKGGTVPVMTPKLASLIQWDSPEPIMTMDALLLAYAEQMDVDGVWWNDNLDPDMLSAPRAGILPSKLKNWQVQQSGYDENEDEEERAI